MVKLFGDGRWLPRGALARFPDAGHSTAADTGARPKTLSCAHEFCASNKNSLKADLSFRLPEECPLACHGRSRPGGPSSEPLRSTSPKPPAEHRSVASEELLSSSNHRGSTRPQAIEGDPLRPLSSAFGRRTATAWTLSPIPIVLVLVLVLEFFYSIPLRHLRSEILKSEIAASCPSGCALKSQIPKFQIAPLRVLCVSVVNLAPFDSKIANPK